MNAGLVLKHECRPPAQALKTFGSDVGIAFSGAEDVALIEYAHLTGRKYRVFRWAGGLGGWGAGGLGGQDMARWGARGHGEIPSHSFQRIHYLHHHQHHPRYNLNRHQPPPSPHFSRPVLTTTSTAATLFSHD